LHSAHPPTVYHPPTYPSFMHFPIFGVWL
jgi:hypothetical protein